MYKSEAAIKSDISNADCVYSLFLAPGHAADVGVATNNTHAHTYQCKQIHTRYPAVSHPKLKFPPSSVGYLCPVARVQRIVNIDGRICELPDPVWVVVCHCGGLVVATVN